MRTGGRAGASISRRPARPTSVARQLAMTDEAGQDALLEALLGAQPS